MFIIFVARANRDTCPHLYCQTIVIPYPNREKYLRNAKIQVCDGLG